MKTCGVQFCKWENNHWQPAGKTYYYNFQDEEAIKEAVYEIKTDRTYDNPVIINEIFLLCYPELNGIKVKEATCLSSNMQIISITGINDSNIAGEPGILGFDSTKNCINISKKENNNMFGMNFEFGKVPSGKFKMSVMGLAYNLGDGRYGVYNMGENEFTDVTELTLDIDGMIYQMPIATKDVAVGDIIKHKDKYVIVKEANASGSITVIEPINRTELNIIPTKSVFGFSFVTKVMNLMSNFMPDNDSNKPSEDNPFGNIMPFMMMSALSEGNTNNNDMMKMLMMTQMFNGDSMNFTNNPLMMMMLMKD